MLLVLVLLVLVLARSYLYLDREDYTAMKARGAVVCEEMIDEASGETRFKILVSG